LADCHGATKTKGAPCPKPRNRRNPPSATSYSLTTPRRSVWELADWLAEYVPEMKPGPSGVTGLGTPISISELADEGYHSERWLRRLRKVAKDTAADRLAEVTPRVYIQALQATKGDLAKANERLQKRGTKLRDQTDNMESTKALVKQILKKPREEKENVARQLYRDLGPIEIDPVEDAIELAKKGESLEDISKKVRMRQKTLMRSEELRDALEEGSPDEETLTVRESYAVCDTPTAKSWIEDIDRATTYLFETDMYKIGKRDRARLRTIYQKGLDALEALDG
jgi:hypothetical protein